MPLQAETPSAIYRALSFPTEHLHLHPQCLQPCTLNIRKFAIKPRRTESCGNPSSPTYGACGTSISIVISRAVTATPIRIGAHSTRCVLLLRAVAIAIALRSTQPALARCCCSRTFYTDTLPSARTSSLPLHSSARETPRSRLLGHCARLAAVMGAFECPSLNLRARLARAISILVCLKQVLSLSIC